MNNDEFTKRTTFSLWIRTVLFGGMNHSNRREKFRFREVKIPACKSLSNTCPGRQKEAKDNDVLVGTIVVGRNLQK